MDFVHGQLATALKIRVPTVVDTFTSYAPVTDPRLSYRAENVVQSLNTACTQVGFPKIIRLDHGSEFISRDLVLSTYANGATLDFSRPGKPTDKAFIETFDGRSRLEYLNAHWCLSLADAREELEDWRRYYNEQSPHGAIGQKPPISLLNNAGDIRLPL